MWGHCELSVEFDEPDRKFEAGGEITGQIHVVVDGDCQCDSLTVSCHWQTHGRGTPVRGLDHIVEVFSGVWEAGREYSHDFRLPVPNGPCSYRGRYLNVDWLFEAEAEIRADAEPSETFDIVVEPADTPVDQPYRSGNPRSSNYDDAGERARSQESTKSKIGDVFFVVLMLAIGLMFGVPGYRELGEGGGSVISVAGGLFFVGLGLMGIWVLWVRDFLAEMKLGDIEVEPERRYVHPDGYVPIEVQIPGTSDDVLINEVRAELKGRERVRYDQGTDTSTKSVDVCLVEHRHPESIGCELEQGESASFVMEVPVPADAPYSFCARRNRIRYRATVRIDIQGWPDWEKIVPVDVVPRSAPTSGRASDRAKFGDAGSGESTGEVEASGEKVW